MNCIQNKPFYIPPNRSGLKLVNSVGDGDNIEIYWHQAYTDDPSFNIAYNIYYSTEEANVFAEGPKLLSTNINGLYTKIPGFTPGDIYYFNVKATEYQSIWYNPTFLPDADGYMVKMYPETLLINDISAQSTIIQISDINLFPPMGIIKIGVEYIQYDSKDIPNGTLLVSQRGFLNTQITQHTTSGFDGYVQQSPIITFFPGLEDGNTFISEQEIKFNYPNFAYSINDGYKVDQDLLTTNLASDSTDQIDFPSYPAQGYRSGATDLQILLNGGCLNSYIGGESGCADDGYGVGMQIRNVSITDVNDQRQELLLSYTGEPVVLVNRLWSGIRCACYESNHESPESRCEKCFGTSFVTGYQQFYNPRDSSGRIMVRFGPYNDDIKQEDSGLESIAEHDCWTLSPYLLRDRDFVIRFNIDGSEEYRYEVTSVNRNKLLFGVSGNQHFKATRIRKTDPIYSWSVFRNTATMPHKVNTAVGLLKGPGNTFIPHVHEIVLNENIMAISQINQTTAISNGHNHQIRAGVVQPSPIDGHSHDIIF